MGKWSEIRKSQRAGRHLPGSLDLSLRDLLGRGKRGVKTMRVTTVRCSSHLRSPVVETPTLLSAQSQIVSRSHHRKVFKWGVGAACPKRVQVEPTGCSKITHRSEGRPGDR